VCRKKVIRYARSAKKNRRIVNKTHSSKEGGFLLKLLYEELDLREKRLEVRKKKLRKGRRTRGSDGGGEEAFIGILRGEHFAKIATRGEKRGGKQKFQDLQTGGKDS